MTDRKLLICASLLYEFKLGTSASSWHLAQVLYARPHVAKMTLAKIAELNWGIILHPSYSPDLYPTDCHLFLSLDNHMKNRAFNIEDDLKTEVHNFFQNTTKDFYKNGITKLLNHWEKAIECEGSFFDE